MRSRVQIFVLVSILLMTSIGLVLYKHITLDFPIFPTQQQDVWTIEARVTFQAEDGPVEVILGIPDADPYRRIINYHQISRHYFFQILNYRGERMARWVRDVAKGEQTLYLRYQTYLGAKRKMPVSKKPQAEKPAFSEEEHRIAQNLLANLPNELNQQQKIEALLSLYADEQYQDLIHPLSNSRERKDKLESLLVDLFKLVDVKARVAKGLYLTDGKRGQKPRYFVEIHDGKKWQIYDPKTTSYVSNEEVILMAQGDEALLEVHGGKDSKVTFATQKQLQHVFKTALEAQSDNKNTIVDLSILSLPIDNQNTFKLLLIVPLGALVLVILRNFVGLRTSGTFMPILLALAFIQTQLVPGIALLLTVVSSGLIFRAYLSRLNLLLIPRISAVVVFIITVFAIIEIVTFKFNLQWGLKVTFFPMVILSWTVERMSILWEEEGAHEVLIQGGGSLISAVLAYLLMSNVLISSIIFIYPELLLSVLALIILIGTYTGYRLSDLRRFKPIGVEK